MLSDSMEKGLNKQISMERQASRDYLSLAIWCDQKGYEGAAKFFYKQSEEERGHMMKIVKYLIETGGTPVIQDMRDAAPSVNSFQEVFETALQHEKDVTQSIHQLTDASIQEKDHLTYNFLQWFVNEQLEEENQFLNILDKIRIIEQESGSIYMLDRELGSRTD